MRLTLRDLLILLPTALLLAGGCGSSEEPNDYSYGSRTAGSCNDGRIDSGEACDGSNLAGQSCASLGLGSGTLSCNATCTGLVTSGCTAQTCTPNCTGKQCGPDGCGGSCAPGCDGTTQLCNANGLCEASSDPNGPTFLSFTINTPSMTPSDTLIFTAILTDPNGVEDLIGGSLVDPNTGSSYGAFATSAAEGSYQLSILWHAIDTVRAIGDAPSSAGIQRSFRAEFYDQAGHLSRQELSVTLWCGAGSGETICAGGCFDLMTSEEHCGACGYQVLDTVVYCRDGAPLCSLSTHDVCDLSYYAPPESTSGAVCREVGVSTSACGDCGRVCPKDSDGDRACVGDGECALLDYEVTASNVTCNQVCAGVGAQCFGDTWQQARYSNSQVDSFSCSTYPAATYLGGDFVELSCYCRGIPAPQPTSCSDECLTASNGICEDGGNGSVSSQNCSMGSDCSDCGVRAFDGPAPLCTAGAWRCANNEVQLCTGGDWSTTESCGADTCVEDGGSATCETTSTPGICDGSTAWLCDGEEVVRCDGTTEVGRLDCADVLGDGAVSGWCYDFGGSYEEWCVVPSGDACFVDRGNGPFYVACGSGGVPSTNMACDADAGCVTGFAACTPGAFTPYCSGTRLAFACHSFESIAQASVVDCATFGQGSGSCNANGWCEHGIAGGFCQPGLVECSGGLTCNTGADGTGTCG